MIAVGVVYQQSRGVPSVRPRDDLEVATLINASVEAGTPWRGFAANHNSLIEQFAGASWYVAVNPDVRTSADAIRRLVDHAEEAELAIAAPLIRTPWGDLGIGSRPFPSPSVWLSETFRGTADRARTNASSPRRTPVVSWVSGACMAIRLGTGASRFDEGFFMYFEDADICYRASQSGLRVGICSDIVVDHDSGWTPHDPLRWRRGVEFARSAQRFAHETGHSPGLMRAAGLLRSSSRVPLPRASSSQRVASLALARGFLTPSAPGLSELAAEYGRRSAREQAH